MDIPEKYKQLWSDWDVRVLILLSLFIQIVLIFLGRIRKTTTLRWIRMVVWCSYLLADWIADFTLGQLSSNMDDSSSSSNIIFAFWAPFLILHLGGPDTITAYSMEDNELWARHLLGLIYELIIAFYVLFRSLPNTHLLTPTLLIFLVAIIKYVERSYSLYKASAEGFLRSISSSARELPTKDLNALNRAFWLYSACKPFFIDAIPSSEVYSKSRDLVYEMKADEVLKATSMEFSYAYDELYTKAIVNHSKVGYFLRVLCSICILLACSLFFLSSKDSLARFDVAITYVLLGASICLDITGTIMLLFSDWMVVSLLNIKKMKNKIESLAKCIVRIKRVWHKRRYWLVEMPQLNLLSNCLKNSTRNEAPQYRIMNWVAKKLGLVQEIKLYMDFRRDFETYTLRTLHASKTTPELLEIIASYAEKCLSLSPKEFNKPAGLSILQQVTPWAVPTLVNLLEGLSLDQQVLVWHITTELCFHYKPKFPRLIYSNQIEIEVEESISGGVRKKSLEMETCKYLSNYMMHMVLMRPKMMFTMGGRSPMVFWDAFDDMVRFIRRSIDDHDLKSNAKVEEVCMKMMTTQIKWNIEQSLFVIARVLAHLMFVIGEEEKWKVVTTMWVELLMKGAKNSRADMHVKQLSKKGELLSFIWLFNKHAGIDDVFFTQEYMMGDRLEMAKQLLSEIELHL